jgi:hypothetical protein
LSAPDPNPLPEPGGLTCRSSAKAATTKANLASREGVCGVRARGRGFPFMLIPESVPTRCAVPPEGRLTVRVLRGHLRYRA